MNLTQVAGAGKNGYVVWSGDPLHTNPDLAVFFRRSGNNGATFDPTITVSTAQGIGVHDPKIVASGSDVYVVWYQGKVGGSSDIFFVASHDGGQNFTQPVNLSNDTFSSKHQIALVGPHVYVTWVSDDPNNTRDIFFTASSGSGKSFNKPANLSKNPSADYTSDFPAIAAIKKSVYVAWQTGYDPQQLGLVPRGDIIFRQNHEYGRSGHFEPPVNLTMQPDGKPVYAWFPKVAAQGHRISVLWTLINPNGTAVLYFSSCPEHGAAAFETSISLGRIYVYSVEANLPLGVPRVLDRGRLPKLRRVFHR
jgi:hypothetical protein